MKHWYRALIALTAFAGLTGLTLALGPESGAPAGAGRALLLAALLGFASAAVMRPRAKGMEAAGVSDGRVPEARREACTFRNVAANEEALRSMKELRDYLMHPEKYVKYGARMPRGVLLYGPPGTGKTLLARALAGEANVPFFALSGSDFVEKYVGVGASRVRELFRKARKAGRCVVFIDEIDAMGKRRDENSTDERDQTLNALLSEMSGFYTGDGVVVLAATNRAEALDPALLRPGRFDRQIEIGLPGRRERLSILRLHSENKPMDATVDLEAMAARTVGFSGASLENLLNEAAMLAAQRDEGPIAVEDVDRAFIKLVAGEDRPVAATPAERRCIALHEAGHALASRLLLPENRLAKISILPAGRGAAGYNLTIPTERAMPGRRELEYQICVLLAGRAAELVTLGEENLSAGAANDLARAAELAAAMVLELGLAGEPALSLRALNRQCGGANDGAERCRALLNRLFGLSCELLNAHARALNALADALLEAEALDGARAEAAIDEALSNESTESA